MTPGIVDTGQHSEQESQQDNDDEDHNHHPWVAAETEFLLLMISSNNLQTGDFQALLRVIFSVVVMHLYGIGITSLDWGRKIIIDKARLRQWMRFLVDCNNLLKMYEELFPLSEMFSY